MPILAATGIDRTYRAPIRPNESWPATPDFGPFSPAMASSGSAISLAGGTWYGHCDPDAISYAIQRSSYGDVMRFEVRSGDVVTSDIGNNVERAEMNGNLLRSFAVNTTYNMEFLHKFEPGVGKTTSNFALFFQLHADEDPSDIGTSPPVRMSINTNWSFDISSATSAVDPLVTFPGYTTRYRDLMLTDVWHHWRIRWRHDWTSSGLLQVWQNSVQLFNYSGPLGWPDVNAMYPQIGIYRGTTGGVDPNMICYLKILSNPTPE